MTRTDQQRAGLHAKRKGERGEREVIDLLREHGWSSARRNFASGGSGGCDVIEGPADTTIEIKYAESMRLPEWWRQAQASARPTDLIVVVSRGNSQPWMAHLRLVDFMPLAPRVDTWKSLSIGPRASVRAEFMGLMRDEWVAHPLVLHQAAGEAMCTVLFVDLLACLAADRRYGRVA